MSGREVSGWETSRFLKARCGPAYLPLLTGIAVLASFTMTVSETIIGVAVPHVIGAFGIGQDRVQPLATAFHIAMTTGQLLNVRLVAAIGQRKAFVFNLVLFFVTGAFGASAELFSVVIVARVVQGATIGLIQTQTMLAVVPASLMGRKRSIA